MTAPTTISDGSDGSSQVLQILDRGVESEKPLDPFLEEYGPLFIYEKKDIHANQIAIAAKFSSVYQIRFDSEAALFVRYSELGLWEPLKEPEVKKSLAKFIKKEAEENDAQDFLRKRTNAFLGAVLELLKGFTLVVDRGRLHGMIHAGNVMLDLSVKPVVLRPFDPSLPVAPHVCDQLPARRRMSAIPQRTAQTLAGG